MGTNGKVSLGIGALALLALLGVMRGKLVNLHVADGPSPVVYEKALRLASEKINSTLPRTVSQGVRLDSTLYGPGKRWTYVYTLVDLSSDETNANEVRSLTEDKIKPGVCSSREMKIFVDNDIQLVYKYRGNDGVFIGDVVVEPGECDDPRTTSARPTADASIEIDYATIRSILNSHGETTVAALDHIQLIARRNAELTATYSSPAEAKKDLAPYHQEFSETRSNHLNVIRPIYQKFLERVPSSGPIRQALTAHWAQFNACLQDIEPSPMESLDALTSRHAACRTRVIEQHAQIVAIVDSE